MDIWGDEETHTHPPPLQVNSNPANSSLGACPSPGMTVYTLREAGVWAAAACGPFSPDTRAAGPRPQPLANRKAKQSQCSALQASEQETPGVGSWPRTLSPEKKGFGGWGEELGGARNCGA